MRKIVILAAGRGRRMRKAVSRLQLEPEQERMAARGLKGLIPIHGRAYLDHVISAAADAGLEDVCLVVGPGRDPIAEHYSRAELHRVRVHIAVQPEPLGTAHALLAAEPFAAGEPVVVINADNYYPTSALATLRAYGGNAMVGFRADTLTSRGNVPATRIGAYALASANGEGVLTRIIEKPDLMPPSGGGRLGGTPTRPRQSLPPSRATSEGGPQGSRMPSPSGAGPGAGQVSQPLALETSLESEAWISMTCWRFGPRMFDACRSIDRSVRGELELVDAVSYAIARLGERFRVLPVDEPVLDLSCREDIETAACWLRGQVVRL